MLDNLPPAENYAKAIFPSLAEQSEAKQAVADKLIEKVAHALSASSD